MDAVGPAGDVATERLSAEQLAKVAGWMRRNLHWKDSVDVIVRDEQRWLAEIEQAALGRGNTT